MNRNVQLVGLSCRFPGVASVADFWRLLSESRTSYDTSTDRTATLAHPESVALLDDISRFEAGFFKISPREAAKLDPQHRMVLEATYDALVDSGLTPSSVSTHRCATFAAQSGYDYLRLQLRHGADVDAHAVLGTLPSGLSNRVNYAFGWGGPSVTVDTACSGSLVALQLAYRAILLGDCDLAVVAAANVLNFEDTTTALRKSGALSTSGRCRPFSAHADGYVRSEGVTAVVLVSDDVLRSLDLRSYARVRSVAVNHNGRSNGLSAPNGSSQERLLQDALSQAAIGPEQMAYIEAHGTGTILGDPIEANALLRAFHGAAPASIALGSVKSNVGHLEAAAGLAGVIKVALAMLHGVIPATLGAQPSNPHIRFEDAPLRLLHAPEPWPHERPCAGVSSFGVTGTNAHTILERVPSEVGPDASDPDLVVLPFTATQEGTLLRAVRSAEGAADFVTCISDWAYRRERFEQRAVLVSRSAALTREAIRRFPEPVSGVTVLTGKVGRGKRRILLLCSGQGSQFAGMAARWCSFSDTFSRAFDDAIAACEAHGSPPLRRFALDAGADPAGLAVQQPVLFAFQVAAIQLLRSYGVSATRIVGQSVGEVAAAVASGALSLAIGASVVVARSAGLDRISGGRMLVTDAPPDRLASHSRLELAGVMAPRSTVVAGPAEDVERARLSLSEDGFMARVVAVDVAAHTSAVEPLKEDFVSALGAMEGERGTVFVPAADLSAQALDSAYWWKNLREPVRLDRALESIREQIDVVVEVSPRAVVLPAIRDVLPAAVCVVVGQREDPEVGLHEALAELFCGGVEIDWSPRFRRTKPSGGSHPWEGQPCWFEPAVHTVRPAPRRSIAAPSARVAAPRESPSKAPGREDALVAAIARVLRVSPLDLALDVPLLALGVDSMTASEIRHSLERLTGLRIETRTVLEAGSIVSLLSLLRTTAQAALSLAPPATERGPHGLPVTAHQLGLVFASLDLGGTGAYNVPIVIEVRGSPRRTDFARAVEHAVQRHPALTTRLKIDESGVLQTFEHSPPAIDWVDCTDAATDERTSELARAPFVLEGGGLFRVAAVGFQGERGCFVFVAHHVISDLWSMDILVRDVLDAYARLAGGETLEPPTPDGYPEYLARPRSPRRLALQREFWAANLAPVRGSIATKTRLRGHGGAARLDCSDAGSIPALARNLGVTVPAVFLAAFHSWLDSTFAPGDFAIGVPFSGREDHESDEMLGYFVRVLPVVLRASSLAAPVTAVRAAHLALGRARGQGLLSLGEIAELAPSFRLSPVLFVFQSTRADSILAQLRTAPVVVDDLVLTLGRFQERTAQFALSFMVTPTPSGYELVLRYDSEFFTAERAAQVLCAVRAHLTEWSGSASSTPSPPWTQRDPEAAADRGPDLSVWPIRPRGEAGATAIRWGNERWSYSTLDATIDAIADRLAALDIGPDQIVGVALERRPTTIATLFAILRLGASFLPLDPGRVLERTLAILEDARPALVLAEPGELREGVPSGLRVLSFEDLLAVPHEPRGVHAAASPSRVAYVIYTSGSTGRPKGVLVTQGSLANYLAIMQSFAPVGADTVTLAKTRLTFDASIWEVFATLAYGGCLVLTPTGEQADPVALGQLMTSTGVTDLKLVPSLLSALLDTNAFDRAPLLRRVYSGGEPLARELANRFYASSSAALYNMYGPTETTVNALGTPVPRSPSSPVLLGPPLRTFEALVVGEDGRVVADGETGELLLAGPGVALGYHNLPEATAARFIERDGQRYYRTGDLVRPIGTTGFEYVGRRDFQVKLRGIRIELGEIEARLLEVTGVRSAAVLLDGDSISGRLVAFTTGTASPEDIEAALERTLPAGFMPSAFFVLDSFPLLTNGKLDRAALRDHLHKPSHARPEEPSTRREQVTLDAIRAVLRRDDVGPDTDLRALGIDSLRSIQVVYRLRALGFSRLSVQHFSSSRTAREVAAVVDPGGLVCLRTGGPSRVLLIHSMSGEVLHYADLIAAVEPRVELWGLLLPEVPRDERDPYDLTGAPTFDVIVGHSVGALIASHVGKRLGVPSVALDPPLSPIPREWTLRRRLAHLEPQLLTRALAQLESSVGTPWDRAEAFYRVLVEEVGEPITCPEGEPVVPTSIARWLYLSERFLSQPRDERFEWIFHTAETLDRFGILPAANSTVIDTDHDSIVRNPAASEVASRINDLVLTKESSRGNHR